MQLGDTIENKYRLVKVMGEGGMGAVYEAEHTVIGRKLAVKLLHPELAQNQDMVSRFLQEARAATAIGSPHIVDVTDAGLARDGSPYLVMEYLEGENLASLLEREGPLPPDRAVALITQVCEALELAHQQGIIHRDLKPENLFLVRWTDGSEWVKVLDFGIAKVRSAVTGQSSQLTRTGATLGTPYYMAPEQYMGTKDVDRRADVYSAGVILYEMLGKARPFEADSYEELIVKVATAPFAQLRTLNATLSLELEQVVHNAIARDPGQRFSSMGELAAALQAASAVGTVSPFAATQHQSGSGLPANVGYVPATSVQPPAQGFALPTTPPTMTPTQPVRSKTPLIAAAAAGALLLLVAGGAGAWLMLSADDEHDSFAATELVQPPAVVQPVAPLPPQPIPPASTPAEPQPVAAAPQPTSAAPTTTPQPQAAGTGATAGATPTPSLDGSPPTNPYGSTGESSTRRRNTSSSNRSGGSTASGSASRHEESTSLPEQRPNRPASSSSRSNLPQRLSRSQVQSGMNSARGRIARCARGQRGTIMLQIVINPSGRVTSANVSGQFAGTPVGSCAARAVRGVRFPACQQSTTVRYPIHVR